MKKTVLLVITIILAMSFAGCGGRGGDHDDVVNVVNILSDQVFDGDITRDAITGSLSAPTFADEAQNGLFGISFDPLSGTEISETRAFLHFTLSGTGVLIDPARIRFATITVFVNSISPVTSGPSRIPFLIDLIDTGLFPAPIVSTDFDAPASSGRATFFREADVGAFVEINITTLLRDALSLGLTDFEVRFRFDRATFQDDLSTVRGLVEIDNADDVPGHRRIDFAPLLHVEFI